MGCCGMSAIIMTSLVIRGFHMWAGVTNGWCALESFFFSLAKDKISAHGKTGGINLHQQIIHHACGVMLRALRVKPRTMRHSTRGNSFDLDHFAGSNGRNRRGFHVSMKVGVWNIEETAVFANVRGRRKESQVGILHGGEGSGIELPRRTKGPNMPYSNIDVFLVWRYCDSVWTVDVHGHHTHLGLLLHMQAARTKTKQRQSVCRFTNHKDEIVLGRFLSRQSLTTGCYQYGNE